MHQVPAGTWRWTTRVDISLASPSYQIRDIVSPYGLLRDSIPLPGEVVQKMAESITTLQSNYAPSIVLGAASLSFIVDEGRGAGFPQIVPVSNGGPLGSLLAVSLTASQPYVLVSPSKLTGLTSGSSGSAEVKIDATTLSSTASPYSASLTVQDSAAGNSPQTVSITVTVRPKAVITVVPDDLSFVVAGPVGGPWPAVPAQSFTLTNTGPAGSVLNYQIQKLTGLSSWITSISSTTGTLNSGAGHTIVVNVAPQTGMLPGMYTETLRVSGYSANSFQDVLVTFMVM